MAQAATQDPAESQVKTDVVDSAVEAIRARVEELRPMHEEFMKGSNMLALLAREPETETPTPRTSRSQNGNGGESGTSAPTRRGGGGQRYTQFMEAVKANPGQKVADYAKALGLNPPNYAYRIASTAIERGDVVRDDDGKISLPSA